jgi:hypothetical protein
MVRHLWLAPVGMLVAGLRSALLLPGVLLAVHLAWRGARSSAPLAPVAPLLPARDAAAALLAPGALPLVTGLLLSGWLLSAALRAAYLAGAMPTLGETLAGTAPRPVFARGVAYRFPRIAAAALVGFGLEVAGGALGLAAVIGTAVLGRGLWQRDASPWAAPAAALVAAAALSLAAFAVVALSAVGDAALARAALREETAPSATARALVRFGQRPAAFVVAALAMALVEAVLAGSVRGVLGLPAGLAPPGAMVLSVGPQLVGWAAAALVASAAELWRLGTIAVLACHRDG